MANIYTLKSGNASDPTVWSGGAVPVSGDRVLICAGHTVTLDGVFEWGDDSTATVVINTISTTASIFIEGTLKASRTVNSQLTCKGHFYINAKAAAYGTYDAGSEADPIPAGVTHTLILNKSSVLGNAKYGLQTYSGGTNLQGKFTAHGAYKKRNATLVYGISSGATSATVTDATGWEVGDTVCFAPTVAYDKDDLRVITSITPVSGTVATIAFPAVTNGHAEEAPVGNFTSNVTFKPFSAASPGWTYMLLQTGFTAFNGNAGKIHLCNARIEGSGGSGSVAGQMGMLNVQHNNVTAEDKVFDNFEGLCFFVPATAAALGSTAQLVTMYSRHRNTFSNCAFYQTANSSGTVFEYTNSSNAWTDTVIYRTISWFASSYSQGGCYCTHDGLKIFGASYFSSLNVAFNPTFTNVVFGPNGGTAYFQAVNSSNLLFQRCDFGSKFTPGNVIYPVSNGGVYNASTVTFEDCKFASGLNLRHPSMYLNLPSYKVTVKNKNADVGSQEIHTPPGSFYRDNVMSFRGTSSIRLEPASFGAFTPYPATYDFPVFAPSGVQQTIVGYLRRNAAYGEYTLPSVTISGIGMTPITYTMSGAEDQWEKFTLTFVQTSGVDGNMTLIFAGQSDNASAKCWIDGIVSAPFVTAYRHYGYKFDSGIVTRSPDSLIQLSEADALALSGLAVDYSTQTLTVTGQRSVREIYDYCRASLCQTANLTQPEFFTSADGANFNCTFNLVIDGGSLTGQGAIAMATNTLTVINGGASSVQITHNGGVFTAISIAGYTVGARLQVFNQSLGLELYNGIPAGASLSIPANWTANQVIRLRMARVIGLDADALIQTYGNLTSSGATFLLTPKPDVVYEANAIDGDTVTEFSADFPNVQIDTNDPDGATTPQRVYAWYMSGQMTAPGIANFHGGMSADDAANYRINVNVLDMRVQNVSTLPCVISGARLYRSDETSIFAVGNGPIQADPSKAYIASESATPVKVDVRYVNGDTIIGHGIPPTYDNTGAMTNPGDPWRPQ